MQVLEKTQVKPTWKPEQIQEMVSHMMANQMMATHGVLAKHGEEIVKEWQAASRKPMIEFYKRQNLKTPIEIIKAKAEMETNVFGSNIEFWGDDKEAHLVYNSCGMWNAMQKCGMNKEQEAKMGGEFENCIKSFAQEFGLHGEVKFEGEKAVITLRK